MTNLTHSIIIMKQFVYWQHHVQFESAMLDYTCISIKYFWFT